MNATTVHLWNEIKSFQKNKAVYIGRPSPYGNPFLLEHEGARGDLILKYKDYIVKEFESDPLMLEAWKEALQGKKLGCFCVPKACHGHVLAALIDEKPWDAYLPPGWNSCQLALF